MSRRLEAAGTVKVLQIKNRFRGHPTGRVSRRQRQPPLPRLHRRAADPPPGDPVHRRTAARRVTNTRKMDLMGVFSRRREHHLHAPQRRQGVTYLVARMVPAALSVVIGWLYVDAFVLKGANLSPSRATCYRRADSVRPTSCCECTASFWPRRTGRMPIWLCRAAGFFGEKARQQRHRKRA